MQSSGSVFNVPALRFPEFSGEWEFKPIGEHIKLQGGYAFKSELFKSAGIPIIRISNLPQESNIVNLSGCVFYDKGTYPNYIVNKGDLLVAMSGATTGKTAIYNEEIPAYLNQRVGLFKADKDIEYSFLYAIVESLSFKSQLNSKLVAGAQPNISSNDIETISVGIPGIIEQRKISKLMSMLNERIEVQSKIIEELKALRSALIDKYVSDGYSQDSMQDIVTLGDNGVFVRGLSYSSSDVTDDIKMTGVVRANNLESGHPVDIDTDIVFVRKQPAKLQQLVFGDIVICMANGSSSLVGKASQYQEMNVNMTVGAFCGIYRGTHPLTRWIFMSSAYSKVVANAIQGGNGAIANLHGEDILAMRFGIPRDCNVVKRLFELYSICDAKIIGAERLLTQYRLQKQFLMHNLFI